MIITIENLTKCYHKSLQRQVQAVSELNLCIKSGEVFGFLGPNGAGKSTVIKILMSFIRPTSGVAFIKGVSVSDPNARMSVGYLPENPYFYDHLTAHEILTFGGLSARMEKHLLKERIDYLMHRVNLTHARSQRLRTFSKGMMQRIGLALALIHDPEVCILDEPMSGLDPLGRRMVADLILEMRDSGKTVFFSSHILSDIERLCDRVGILNHGSMLYCGDVKSLSVRNDGLEDAFIKLVEKNEKIDNGANLAVG